MRAHYDRGFFCPPHFIVAFLSRSSSTFFLIYIYPDDPVNPVKTVFVTYDDLQRKISETVDYGAFQKTIAYTLALIHVALRASQGDSGATEIQSTDQGMGMPGRGVG